MPSSKKDLGNVRAGKFLLHCSFRRKKQLLDLTREHEDPEETIFWLGDVVLQPPAGAETRHQSQEKNTAKAFFFQITSPGSFPPLPCALRLDIILSTKQTQPNNQVSLTINPNHRMTALNHQPSSDISAFTVSAVSQETPLDLENDDDDSQIFFVTCYSDFDKLGTFTAAQN